MSKYPQYQDYVIRDGKLIGEFEQMYADFEDPWEQSTREEKSIEKLIGLHLLAKNKHTRPLSMDVDSDIIHKDYSKYVVTEGGRYINNCNYESKNKIS